MRRLPHTPAAHKLLQTLLAGPGTFYQICERAGIDVERVGDENVQRALFAKLLDAEHIYLDKLTYSISSAARLAIDPPAPYVGEVAGPAYRGTVQAMPVHVVRRERAVRP